MQTLFQHFHHAFFYKTTCSQIFMCNSFYNISQKRKKIIIDTMMAAALLIAFFRLERLICIYVYSNSLMFSCFHSSFLVCFDDVRIGMYVCKWSSLRSKFTFNCTPIWWMRYKALSEGKNSIIEWVRKLSHCEDM